jgi:hypothetical protein
MAKADNSVPQAPVSINDEPIDLLEVSDELGRIYSFMECASLALPEACADIKIAGAIQSVLMKAQDMLETVLNQFENERERQGLVEAAQENQP